MVTNKAKLGAKVDKAVSNDYDKCIMTLPYNTTPPKSSPIRERKVFKYSWKDLVSLLGVNINTLKSRSQRWNTDFTSVEDFLEFIEHCKRLDNRDKTPK